MYKFNAESISKKIESLGDEGNSKGAIEVLQARREDNTLVIELGVYTEEDLDVKVDVLKPDAVTISNGTCSWIKFPGSLVELPDIIYDEDGTVRLKIDKPEDSKDS